MKPRKASPELIGPAVEAIENHGVAAIPTDTFYGLAASALDETAVERVFRLKGRPAGAALPMLIADSNDVSRWAEEVPDVAWHLAERFWPGALTLVLKRGPTMPEAACGGLDTVGLRVPDHWIPRAIARELGSPITGTSANRRACPGLTTAAAVRTEFGAEVEVVVDGGETPGGPASTVLDLTGDRPRILRRGGVSEGDISAVCKETVAV